MDLGLSIISRDPVASQLSAVMQEATNKELVVSQLLVAMQEELENLQNSSHK